MGQISEDILDGSCCAECGCYFMDDDYELFTHGYPVVCADCHDENRPRNTIIMTVEELIDRYEAKLQSAVNFITYVDMTNAGTETALGEAKRSSIKEANVLRMVIDDLRALQSEPTEPLFGAEPWDCSKSYKDGSYVVEDANGNELCMMFRPDYPDSTVDRIARLITHAPEYRRIALALRDNDSNGSIATEKRLKAREELDKLEAEVLNSQT